MTPRIFFTADWHLNHTNIIKYTGRVEFMSFSEQDEFKQFKPATPSGVRRVHTYSRETVKDFQISPGTLHRMNSAIIDRVNEVVRPEDTLVNLGDIGFFRTKEEALVWLRKINCKNWVVIFGNHDKRRLLLDTFLNMSDKTINVIGGYESDAKVYHEWVCKWHGQSIVCSHFPLASWDREHYGTWNLHGHCHGSYYNPACHSKQLDVGVDLHAFYPVSFEEVKAELTGAKAWTLNMSGPTLSEQGT